MISRRAALLMPATLFLVASVYAKEISNIVIYLHDWDADTRHPLSAEDVREQWYIRTEIRDSIAIDGFMKNLPSSWSENPDDKINVGARLVIDVRKANGDLLTYYASQFYLYTDNGLRRTRIDESFKNRFRIVR